MALTAPQEASVVMVANSAELKMPKRTSLPSMLPSGSGHAERLVNWIARCLGRPAEQHARQEQIIMALQMDQPCAWF